jgi:predicted AlkP superfamily pyrophosphatase or phosphodiesterase
MKRHNPSAFRGPWKLQKPLFQIAKRRSANLVLLIMLLLTACSAQVETPGPSPTIPPTPTTAPTPTTTPAKQTVFLVSWDGGRADLVYNLMEKGDMPNFAELTAGGLRAEYARSVDPSLTVVAQNSISTGSYPARTGLVSNSFHNPNDSFYWYRVGFDELIDQAEPVWVTASNAGLTTAAVFFVGGSPGHPGQMADYTIGYGVRDAYSRQESVDLAPLEEDWEGELPVSYSPPFEGSFTIREVARVHLYVLDLSDDNTANYDAVIVGTERKYDQDTPLLGVGEWGPLVLMPRVYAGADFLIQEIEGQGSPARVKLFYSNVYHNTAAPRPLLEELNQKFGFFLSGPDYYALEHGWITPEDNLYLLERASLWMAEVAAWVQDEYQPDLLFTWQDGFDAAGHSYLMQDPRSLNYSPENAERYAGYYRRAAGIADQALEIMLGAIDLEHTTLLMVADHGMAPIHSVVYVNTILEQAGLLTLDDRNYVVVEDTKVFAVASGGAAHIYINLIDHERYGTVTPEEYPLIQEQIMTLFSTLVDPDTGEAVFQRVLRQDELAPVHLDHLNAGDVFVQAAPGYHLDGWRGNETIFEGADFYGQHGYDSSLPEMRAIFIAAGRGVPTTGETIPAVRIVDYAPTIAALLGFEPAGTVDGQPIPALTGTGP